MDTPNYDEVQVRKWATLVKDPNYLVPRFAGADTINGYKGELGDCARMLLFEHRITRRLAHVWCFTSKQGGFPSPFAEYMTEKYGVDPANWPNPWVDDAIEWATLYERSLDVNPVREIDPTPLEYKGPGHDPHKRGGPFPPDEHKRY